MTRAAHSRLARLEQGLHPRRPAAARPGARAASSTSAYHDDGAPVLLSQRRVEVRPLPPEPAVLPASVPESVSRAEGDPDGEAPALAPAAVPAPEAVEAVPVPERIPDAASSPAERAVAPAPTATAAPSVVAPVLPDDGPDAFAQDVAAILAATAPRPAAGHVFPLPAPAAQEPDAAAAPAASPGSGGQPGHGVFDAMQVPAPSPPQRFDAGPVTLSVDFARLDAALAKEGERPAGAVPAAAPAAPPPAPAGPGPAAQERAEVLPTGGASAPSREPAQDPRDAVEVAQVAQRARPFRITTDAPLVPQVPGLSCHAAACASLVAWRDDVPPDPHDVAAGNGYWQRYAGARTARHPDVLAGFGLVQVPESAPPFRLAELVDAHGPLWMAAAEPGEHAVVVAGLSGDGTTSGTVVDVVDPWARGMHTFATPNPGSRYALPYAELVAALGGPAGQVVLARLEKGVLR